MSEKYDQYGKYIGSSHNDGNGNIQHYDQYGQHTGSSQSEKYFDGSQYVQHYDQYGQKTGSSRVDIYGYVNHYDKYGNKTGSSYADYNGKIQHFDKNGNKTGTTYHEKLSNGFSYDGNAFIVIISIVIILCLCFIFIHEPMRLITPAILFTVGVIINIVTNKKLNENFSAPFLFITDGLWMAAWIYLCDLIAYWGYNNTDHALLILLSCVFMFFVLVAMCYIFFGTEMMVHASIIFTVNFALGIWGLICSFSKNTNPPLYHWLPLIILSSLSFVELVIKLIAHGIYTLYKKSK